ncbi:MAG: glycoside hydrolase family protein [Actinomycetia bacterium]|nr:glycoside hydrolase family protein [Actinomycetes bacterium]
MPLPIEDYGIIGDTQTAALVGLDGSIDWLCLPHFGAGACFSALLGTPDHGRWLLAPAATPSRTTRRYRFDTLVLETDFTTDTGTVRIIDFMPPRDVSPDLVRIVEGMSGEVEMTMDLVIRFEYGSEVPWVHHVDGSLRAVAGPNSLTLRTPIHVDGKHMRTNADFTVHEGERIPFVLAWANSWHDPPKPIDPEQALSDTEDFWTGWSRSIDPASVDGPWEDEIRRSLITLKALTYEPTGGIVAAPTTSLPEKIGGVRNWDYRYCWVRDASLTLHAMIQAGLGDEASAWSRWLARAAAGAPEQLQILYGIGGERRLTELELPWLPGYESSKPVRIGNAASDQFQLDVYGELMFAFDRARRLGVQLDDETWALQIAFMDFLEKHWTEPDEGIWEVRGPRRHFVHSRVMAWVAADCAVRAVEEHGLVGPVERWRALRDEIHEEVCREGYNKKRKAFTQYYGSHELDASVLMVVIYGFLPPDDERVVNTVAAIESELVVGGFVQRYQSESGVDGLPPGEGAFLPCSFWLVDCLAKMGRVDDARTMFERLLTLTNDLGLLSEEYDTESKRLVGNFPQAFSHVGLVNAAHTLCGCLGYQPQASVTIPPGVRDPLT